MTFNDAFITIVLSAAIILLMTAAVIIVTIVASRQRVKQLMNIATLQLNYEKELRVAEYEMQEATMNAIARDLHDNVGQLLSLLKIQIESTRLRNPSAQHILSPLDDTLMNVHEQLRCLSKTLSSDTIYQQGILFAINRDLEKLRTYTACSIYWEHDDTEPQLNDDERLMVYRIYQELMQNVFRHAQASEIRVTLRARPFFSLQIADNGSGFDYDQALHRDGSGIRNILKRSAMASLHCVIRTGPGQGTSITLSKEETKN